MVKLVKRVMICFAVAALVWCGTLIADRQQLHEELIRLHVVANSDTEADQAVKLQVRDAVIKSLEEELKNVADVEQAKAYIRENLPKIQQIANQTLEAAGFDTQAVVSLCQEAFDTREYDTFSLPAGVYESLRIVIGEGQGHNWWCVVFPSLCLPVAQTAGFPDSLNSALTGEEGYELRFYLLDAMGRLENILFQG